MVFLRAHKQYTVNACVCMRGDILLARTHQLTNVTEPAVPHASVAFHLAHSAEKESYTLIPSLLVPAEVNDFCLMSP